MLFAAGFGTRMGTLTAHKPKPLISVAGRPLIDHALTHVEAYGADRIVVNTHYLPDQIADHLQDSDVVLSNEAPDILETGGGLRAALPFLGKAPVFTMNTDAVWRGPNPLDYLAARWMPEKMDALLLCIPTKNAVGHKGQGDFLLAGDGALTRGHGQIYSGLQIIKTDRLTHVSERRFSLNLLWDMMLADGTIYGATYPGHWCDVGQPESIALAEALLEGGDV